jgi:hypothetical protein
MRILFLLASIFIVSAALDHSVSAQNKDFFDTDGIGNGIDSFGNQMSSGFGPVGPTVRELFQGWMQLLNQAAQGGGTVGSQVSVFDVVYQRMITALQSAQKHLHRIHSFVWQL